MIKEDIFYFNLLFFLFLIGSITILFSIKERHDASSLLRKGMVGIFFIHIFLYVLAGKLNIPFGWQRNFFYLLPVYFLVIFYLLKKIIKRRIYYYIVSSILLIFSLSSSIKKCSDWQYVNLLREMVRLAQQNQCDSLIISQKYIDRWPYEYYVKKYNIGHRVLFLSVSDDEKKFSEIIRELASKDKFVVVQAFSADVLINKDTAGNMKTFEIVEKKARLIEVRPYTFRRISIGGHPQQVFEYYYVKK